MFGQKSKSEKGFTLIELVITLVVLSVLALGTIPLVQNAVRRQKEQRLRETLAQMRQAIDEFHRDSAGVCNAAGGATADPRSRVMISECKIFEVDNIDRFPPTLEALVEGVMVKPRNAQLLGGKGAFDDPNGATKSKDGGATEEKKKVYLPGGELPVDPITGKSDWKIRSCYQDKDAGDWDNINVFDVRSAAEGEALDGTKYSEF